MFFFFPFAESLAPALAPQRLFQAQALPMLPIPAARREEPSTGNAFCDAVSYAGSFGVDVIRQVIASFTSSLTALGSRSNQLFSQVAAALAFDRMARQAASLAAMGFAAFGLPSPQPAFNGFWPAPALPGMQFPFAFPPAAMNPWAAFTEMFNVWAGIWAPGQKPGLTAPYDSREKPPFNAIFSVPGCSWSLTVG